MRSRWIKVAWAILALTLRPAQHWAAAGSVGKQRVTAHTEQDSNHSDMDRATKNSPGFQLFSFFFFLEKRKRKKEKQANKQKNLLLLLPSTADRKDIRPSQHQVPTKATQFFPKYCITTGHISYNMEDFFFSPLFLSLSRIFQNGKHFWL